MGRNKGGKNDTGNIHKDFTELIQQVWGCLADATPYGRYECYAREERVHPPFLAYWSEREVKTFRKNIKAKLGIKIDITKRDKFKDIIRKIKDIVDK